MLLSALNVYVRASLLLQLLNHRSFMKPLILITGSSALLTDTCWGQRMTSPTENLITSKSHIWVNDTEYSVLHHLHYIPCCVTEKKNRLKTNGLSSPLLGLRHIIKVHSTFISWKWKTGVQLLKSMYLSEGGAKRVIKYF